MRFSGSLGAVVVGLALAWPGVAAAQDEAPPASVRGLKIAIPEATGRRSYGGAALSRALRRTMVEAVGPLVPSRDLASAQKKLKQSRRARKKPENLAKAGKASGAQYVLAVSVSKKKWLYTARALLINTATGEVQMDFRSQYYKPGKEAADRGIRIGSRTIQKLDELMQSGGLPPAVAVAPPPPPPPDDLRVDDPPPDDLRVDDPPPPPPVVATGPPPPPPPTTTDPAPPVIDDPPPPPVTSAPPPPPPAFANSNSNSLTTEVGPVPERKRSELIRIAFGAGSGLLHTYDIAPAGGDNSRLSHQLEPLALVDLRAEFIAPVVPVSLTINAAYRPVKYNIRVADEGEVTPSGSMLDVAFLAGYQIGIAGEGLETYKIIPSVGARIGLSNVSEHPGNVVLSNTTIAVVGGLGLRLPFNEVLEVSFGVDGGLIVGYSEKPLASGDGGGGFTIGGELGARIWLSDAIAIALDNRFTFESISLDGSPSRQLPDSEQAGLQNAAITTKDLRTTAGVAVRF